MVMRVVYYVMIVFVIEQMKYLDSNGEVYYIIIGDDINMNILIRFWLWFKKQFIKRTYSKLDFCDYCGFYGVMFTDDRGFKYCSKHLRFAYV